MGFTFRNWVEWGGVEHPRRGGGFWGASPLVRSSSLKPEQNFNDSDTGKYLKRPDKQMSTVWSGRVCGVCARACMHIQWKESFINFFPFLSQNYKSLTLFWHLMYYFWDKILCSSRLTLSSGWSWTSYLLASASQTVGEQVCPATPTGCGVGGGNWTQDFVYTWQEFHHLTSIPNPSFSVKRNSCWHLPHFLKLHTCSFLFWFLPELTVANCPSSYKEKKYDGVGEMAY